MMSSSENQDLTYLANTVDKLLVRLSSIEPSSLEQIEEWREVAYRSVDHYCEQKRRELIGKKQLTQQTELEHLQNQINQLNKKHDIKQDHYDSINHDIQLTEIKINELEHLRLTVHPLVIDEHLIIRRHLFPLSHPYKTIHLKTGLESAVSTNNQHLLVYREDKNLCLLDRNFTIVKEIPFVHDDIHGVCWSSTVNRFIIITFKEILSLDENKMILEKCPVPSKVDWWRGTCSDDILYLSTVEWGSSIYQFNLRSSFKFVKEWHAPKTCKKEEIICDLKYHNDFLAMPIYNKYQEQSRFDLRSVTTLDCIWSIRIHGRCRCCSIDVDQWLVMDHDDRRFFHISADGKLLEADKYDQHERLEDIISWGIDDIIVLTKKTINLHKLN